MHAQDIADIWQHRRTHYAARDIRIRKVRDAITGEFSGIFSGVFAEGEEPILGNLLTQGARTMAQRVTEGLRIHGVPKIDRYQNAKTNAERHEAEIFERVEDMRLRSLLPQVAFWMVCHGFVALQMLPHTRDERAFFQVREPASCYPDTVWPHQPEVNNCLFVHDVPPHLLATQYPEALGIVAKFREEKGYEPDVKVAEMHTKEGVYIAMVEPEAYMLYSVPNPNGRSNVWVPRDFTPDLDFYGQFDQVIPILTAQAKLNWLTLSYAEQQVFAETWITGRITSNGGRPAYGPGAVNVLDPEPGAGAQKLTNNMSPQVFDLLDRLERQVRLGGAIPSQLSGEPNTTIATGRGLDRLTAFVDTNIAHYQKTLAAALQDMFREIPNFEESHGWSSPRFDRNTRIFVSFTSGSDPATTVRLLQLQGNGLLSKSKVREQLPEIDDPLKEEAAVQMEMLEDAYFQSLLAQASQGAIDPQMILFIRKQLTRGVDLFDAVEKWQQEQSTQMQGLGLAPAGTETAPLTPPPGPLQDLALPPALEGVA